MSDHWDLGRGPWVDNHCHIDLDRGNDGAYAAMRRGGTPEEERTLDLLGEAHAAGVVGLVTVGTDGHSSRRALELAARHPTVWATAGVHPHEAKDGTDELRRVLEESAGRPELVAIGEAGLDFHYDHSPRATQREVFAEQIRLAHELHLPLVIHTREAWDETFAVLDSEGVPPKTVFHCFTGGPAEAEGCLERGAWLSISGIVTFPSAKELREAVQRAPLDRLMVETDSPYLTPVPFRGKPNSPSLVGHVGAEVARLQDRDVDEVAATTTSTAKEFYGLSLP